MFFINGTPFGRVVISKDWVNWFLRACW